jgi:hypothetical protein
MDRVARVALLSGLSVLALSCTGSSGFIRDSVTSHTFQYNFTVTGMRFIRTVAGQASVTKVLCTIPIDETDLYNQAVKAMYAQAGGLGPNRVVVNLREDSAFVTYLFVACTTKLTVSGDLVELLPAPPAAGSATEPRGPSSRRPDAAQAVTDALVQVPHVIGRRLLGAKQLIEKRGLAVGDVRYVQNADSEDGVVLSQTPAADTDAFTGTKVDLVINGTK